MKISVSVAVVLLFSSVLYVVRSDKIIQPGIIDIKEGADATGTWRTKLQWRYYWVKDWELKQMYVPIWKKVWSPIEVREWFPFPNPPPPPLSKSGEKLRL